MSDVTIPTIDLDELKNPAGPSSDVVDAIRVGFGRFGLLYVANHGVSDTTALYDLFSAFTGRSDQDKRRFHRADLWYQRGYTPPNTEKAVVASGQPDFKECWFAAPHEMDSATVARFPEICCPNIWPDDRASGDGATFDSTHFAELYLRLGRELHEAGLALLRGTALALGLAHTTFDPFCEGAPHVFRLLKYLPLNAEQIAAKVLWGEEHTDFNLVTLLPGGRFHGPDGKVADPPDANSGLYLRTRPDAVHPEGIRVRGTAPKGCLVAQVGQMLEILTGGELVATPHVVTSPLVPGWSRFSAAHFIHVHPERVLFPLPQFQSIEITENYRPPVLAGTYSMKTLVDIGLAPPSALSALGYRHYRRLASIREKEGSR